MLEVQKATLDVAGASRLDQIRASMNPGPQAVEGSAAAGAIEAGEQAGPVPGQQVGQATPQPQPAERPEA
jgi:hypothetical protein